MSQLGLKELLAEMRPARKYELEDIRLGSGGDSRLGVYVGVCPLTGDKCAIKRLRADDEVMAKGPIEEFRRMRDVQHINLVTCEGIDQKHDDLGQLTELWLIMELCEQATLTDLARKGLTGSRAVTIAQQILSGLEHLHKNQIIHRDLKGNNVLISSDGTIKLADFGISKKLQDVTTRTGEIEQDSLGTWQYMPPEAVNDESEKIGRRADMWSFGCLVIEMVTGRTPLYRSDSTGEEITVSSHAWCQLIGKGRGPRFTKESFPRSYSECQKTALMTVVEGCVTAKPSDRPTAAELLLYFATVFGKETVDDQMAALLGAFTLQEKELAARGNAGKSDFSDIGASALVTIRLKSFLSDDQRMTFSPFTDEQNKPAKFRQLPFFYKRYVMMDMFSGLEIHRFIAHYLDYLRTFPSSSKPYPCGVVMETDDEDIKQLKNRSDVEIDTIRTFNKVRQYDTVIVWLNGSSNTSDKLTTKKQLEDVFSIKAAQLIIIGPFRTGTKSNNAQDLSSRCRWKLLIGDAQDGKRLLRVPPTALTSDVFP